MKLDGEVTIEAGRQRVWDFLTNPEAVSQCAPGLESLEIIEPDKKFRARAGVGFGTMKVRFVADIEWLELDPPNRAKMKAHGSAPGSTADVHGEMELIDEGDEQTTLKWTADVTISGTITMLASRMMGSVTEKVSQEFFNCVQAALD